MPISPQSPEANPHWYIFLWNVQPPPKELRSRSKDACARPEGRHWGRGRPITNWTRAAGVQACPSWMLTWLQLWEAPGQPAVPHFFGPSPFLCSCPSPTDSTAPPPNWDQYNPLTLDPGLGLRMALAGGYLGLKKPCRVLPTRSSSAIALGRTAPGDCCPQLGSHPEQRWPQTACQTSHS